MALAMARVAGGAEWFVDAAEAATFPKRFAF